MEGTGSLEYLPQPLKSPNSLFFTGVADLLVLA